MFLCRLPFCLTFGSILGSILGSFWEPSSPLYSFWVALGCLGGYWKQAYSHRWTGLLAVAAQRALATTLLELPVDEVGADGELPLLEDVLHEGRLLEAPIPSQLSAA